MKSCIITGLMVLLLAVQTANAQVNVVINLRSPVPAQFSVWAQDRTILQLVMTSQFRTTIQDVRMAFVIRDVSTGVVVAESMDGNPNIPSFPIFPFQPNVRYGPELVSASAVRFDEKYKKNAIFTNSLPEGVYELCVRLFNNQGVVISTGGSVCQTFVIDIPDPPTLILPENKYVLSADSGTVRFGNGVVGKVPPRGTGSLAAPLMFVWTPVTVAPGITIRYKFTLAPIFQNQSPRDGIDRNIPLLQQEVTIPNLLYTPNYPDFALYPTAVGFAWQVQALDSEGRPATRNEGLSEIYQINRTPLKQAPAGSGVAPGTPATPVNPAKIFATGKHFFPMTKIAGAIEWGFRKPSSGTTPAATGGAAVKMAVGKSFLLGTGVTELPVKQGPSAAHYMISDLLFLNGLDKTFPLRNKPLELVQINMSSHISAAAGGTIKKVYSTTYKTVASTTTDNEGKFSFNFVNMDSSTTFNKITYSVRVRDFHFEDPPDAFEVNPNESKTDLKLQATARAYSLSVNVVEEDGGLPVKGAQVVAYRQSTAWDSPPEEGNIEDKSAYPYSTTSVYAKAVQGYAVQSYTGVSAGSAGTTPGSGGTGGTGGTGGAGSTATAVSKTSTASTVTAVSKTAISGTATSPYEQLNLFGGSWDPLYLCAGSQSGKYLADRSFMNDPSLAKDYYRLVVTAPGHERFVGGTLQSKVLATGKTVLEFTVKLKKAKPEIRGIVSRADNGNPVSGALVEIVEGTPAGTSSLSYAKLSGMVSKSALFGSPGSPSPPPSGGQVTLSTAGLTSGLSARAKTQVVPLAAKPTIGFASLVPKAGGMAAILAPPNPFAVLSAQDGAYSISNIPPKPAYMIKASKPGFKPFPPTAVTLNEMGLVQKYDIQLEPISIEISGVVVDDEGVPLKNAGVKSATNPKIYYSGPDGHFAGMFGVGEDTLHVFKPGYYDRVFGVTIKKGGSKALAGASVDTMVIPRIVLTLKAAKLLVTVLDSADHLPLKNAAVIVGDSDQVGTTADDGTFFFRRAPATTKLTIGGPDDQDFVTTIQNASLVVSETDTNKLTVALLRGGRFAGTVRRSSDNAGVSGARVRVEGLTGLETYTDNAGKYILRGVPADAELTLKATKSGLLGSGKGGQRVSSGGNVTVDFTLTATSFAINTLLGFDIEVDTLIVTGPDTLLTGSFIHLPNNLLVKLKNAATRVPFTKTRIHSSGGLAVPDGNAVKTDMTQITIRVFDQVEAVLSDETGLTASWNSSAGAGEIKGSVGLSLAPILDNVPGLSLVTSPPQMLRIPGGGGSTIPAITSSGAVPFASDSLGLSAGSTLKISLWNTELTVDLATSSLKADGLHYCGSLKMPSIAGFTFPDLLFKNLHIDKSGVKAMSVSASPPLAVSFPGGWKAQMDKIDFSETGFSLGGNLEFKLPGMSSQNISFSDLKLSTTDFFGGTFHIEKINLFNITEFTVPGKVLAFGKTEGTYFLQGSGKISVKYIDDLTIENFLVRTDGKLMVKVPINLKFNFAFVKVTLKSAQFSTLTTPVSLDITGDINLNLPGLAVKVGGFHYKPGGVFSVDELGLGFTAGPVDLAVQVAFVNDGFAGKGKALIAGLPGLGVEFAYSATLLRIEFSVGVVIPIAPPTALVITEIRGGVERNVNVWTVHIGGTLALSPGSQSAIKLDLDVYVSNGPVIKGNAAVFVLNKFQLANASLEINIPGKYVLGSVWIELPEILPTVSAKGTLNFEFRNADYWFLDAGLEVRMHMLSMDLFKGNFGVAIGKNYNPSPAQNAIAGRVGSVPTINGIRVDAYISESIGSKDGFDFIIVSGAAWASLSVRGALIMNFGSVYGVDMAAHFDVGAKACLVKFCVGGGGTADIGARAFYYVGKGWDLDFSGRVSVWLQGGDCDPSCNEVDFCWDLPPAGGKVCMSLGARARYTSWDGIDLAITQ
jgi:hypothetical protein